MSDKTTTTEAKRILHNMSVMPDYNGTTTADVVDYFCENWDTFILCRGYGRNVVFTPITAKTFSFRTVAR